MHYTVCALYDIICSFHRQIYLSMQYEMVPCPLQVLLHDGVCIIITIKKTLKKVTCK